MAQTQQTKPIPIPKATNAGHEVELDESLPSRICFCQMPNETCTTILPKSVSCSADDKGQRSVAHEPRPYGQASSLDVRGFFPDDDELRKSAQDLFKSQWGQRTVGKP
ncbi:hypothetical protein EJ08DRAFT_701778 [Tothia fuscella]|uniref:Uncharacterized protein n=1 Tax=Tothia fuscella TaxID=1048955 RepID=A0A9P4NI99_9PEZI|nr:hypothetical protein EJ08DRAFT_701778 [Tothia fuscella]